MKKVLILTISTGEGHNQAANSLIESFSLNGYTCIRHDFLTSSSKFLNKLFVKGYEIFATRFPKLYGLFYNLTNRILTNKLLNLIFYFTCKKILRIIQLEKPDIIIGTHAFTTNILHLLRKKGCNIPFISVVTDFKAHYTYFNPLVDAYITASEFTKNSLIAKGINSNTIYPVGIPIRADFFERNSDIHLIKNADKDYFSLLLMSGSMGLSNISFVLDELLKNKNKLRITVVCGNNTHLKDKLSQKSLINTFKDKKLHILGFSNDIASLMQYSDIIISKPGGLTVSEAIATNLPIIIPFVIPGQEMENTEFLTSEGCAFQLSNIKDINNIIDEIIEKPFILKGMRKQLKLLSSSYSPEKILDISNSLINKKI